METNLNEPASSSRVRERSKEMYVSRKTGVTYVSIDYVREGDFHPRFISLFTGAGGLDIGLETVGFETAVCVEIDPDCRETLRYNRPSWKLFEDGKGRIPGDIRTITADELLEFSGLRQGEAALVVGGAPCQPFSNIGKKRGVADPENGDLFREFVRIVKGTEPCAFLFENVTGIVQAKHAEIIADMQQSLEGLGYGIAWHVLNAADYGVPQKRERFFLLGIKGSSIPAFPLPTHFRSEQAWRQFIGSLDPQPDHTRKPWAILGDALAAIPPEADKRDDYVQMNISDKVKDRMTYIRPGENFKVLPMELRPDCWKNGRHQGHDTFGRLELDAPSVTIRTAAYNPMKGRYIHPTENRGLSTVEMAAIQGFPPDWIFKSRHKRGITLLSAGKQIGNAVPPMLGRALGIAVKLQLLPHYRRMLSNTESA